MKERKARRTRLLVTILASVMLLLIGIFFLNQLLAHLDPASFNYRIERLTPEEAVDAYLHTKENIISLVFMTILLVYLASFLVAVWVRRNSLHLAMIVIGQVLFVTYTVVRLVYCYSLGSTSIIVGMFYTVSAIAGVVMIYEFIKRGLDGDSLLPYTIAAIICFGTYFFASATKSSYSLLNSFAHISEIIDDINTRASHSVPDLVYFGGYATTRLFALTFALLVYGNNNFEFTPELILEKKEEAVQE